MNAGWSKLPVQFFVDRRAGFWGYYLHGWSTVDDRGRQRASRPMSEQADENEDEQRDHNAGDLHGALPGHDAPQK
jgi:hypothetical protein